MKKLILSLVMIAFFAANTEAKEIKVNADKGIAFLIALAGNHYGEKTLPLEKIRECAENKTNKFGAALTVSLVNAGKTTLFAVLHDAVANEKGFVCTSANLSKAFGLAFAVEGALETVEHFKSGLKDNKNWGYAKTVARSFASKGGIRFEVG